jgi:hypothetical protein
VGPKGFVLRRLSYAEQRPKLTTGADAFQMKFAESGRPERPISEPTLRLACREGRHACAETFVGERRVRRTLRRIDADGLSGDGATDGFAGAGPVPTITSLARYALVDGPPVSPVRRATRPDRCVVVAPARLCQSALRHPLNL